MNLCFFSSLTKAGKSRGLVMRTLVQPSRRKTMQFPVSAKIWYSGSAVIAVPCVSRGQAGSVQAVDCRVFATMLPWLSIAPFETPVVPPVYCRKARSSWPRSICCSAWRAPAASTSRKRWWPGSDHAGTCLRTVRTTKSTMAPFGKPSSSPTLVTTTCFTCVRPMTSCSTCAKFSRITTVSAPESFSWCSSSRAV